MNDVKSFYSERLAKTGFKTTADVVSGGESACKMTIDYQNAAFAMATELMGRGVHDIQSILDVGCGTGDLLPYLRKAGFTGEYTGVDIVPGFIDGCRSHYSDDHHAEFVCGDFTDRKFRKSIGKFDTILSLSVFGLVDRPSFIRELVESCFDSMGHQYIFTCNSTHEYDKPSNKGTMLYDPAETMMMVSGFTSSYSMIHRHFDTKFGGFSLMAWRMAK